MKQSQKYVVGTDRNQAIEEYGPRSGTRRTGNGHFRRVKQIRTVSTICDSIRKKHT